jgi:hypothetical protein
MMRLSGSVKFSIWPTFIVVRLARKLKYYYTNEEKGQKLHRFWTNACRTCALKQRRITRWEHEEVLEAVQTRLDKNPDAMRTRLTVEHP